MPMPSFDLQFRAVRLGRASRIVLATLLSLSILPSPFASLRAEELFQYEGRSVQRRQLSPKLQQQLYDNDREHLARKERLLQEAIIEEHAKALATKQKKKVEEVRAKLLEVDLSPAKLREWYRGNQARLGGRSFESIKSDIEAYLAGQERDKKTIELVQELEKKGTAKLKLAKLDAPVQEIATNGFPSKGPSDAKVTVVEFADYRCNHCREAVENLRDLQGKYKKDLRLVSMDFPLAEKGLSIRLAIGGVCADEQQKFWPYHYNTFEQQLSLTAESPEKIAASLSLDLPKFKKCMDSASSAEKVKKAREEGVRLGIQGTPAIYVNGQKVASYQKDDLEKAVKSQLKRMGS